MKREKPLWLPIGGIIGLHALARDYFGPPDSPHPRSQP